MKKYSDSAPLVSVVVLNWNGIHDTIQCLRSLEKQNYANIEVIVVDNGSTESIAPLLSYNGIPYVLVKNSKNLGFTGGEISGLSRCSGDYILILNNDAIIEKTAIEKALSTFELDEKIAAVGGRSYILDDDGKKQGVAHYTYQAVDPLTAGVVTYAKDDGVIQDVSNISGACVLIKRSVIDTYGYFDNTFFAYYEETDLFSRYRRAGLRVVFNPEVIIWHKMGASTRDKKYMYNYLMLKNQFLFAYKNFDKRSLKYFTRINRRHFLRSLSLYVRRMGRLSKDDVIHKARVDAYLTSLIRRPQYLSLRRKTQSVNPTFSINDQLFADNPLPISLLIDARNTTDDQQQNLISNLDILNNLTVRPNEVIVVSDKKIPMPKNRANIRIENIVDKKIFDYSLYDIFFMTSNNDMLLFGNQAFVDTVIRDTDSISSDIRDIYTIWETEEAHALVSGPTSGPLALSYFKDKSFKIIALRKTSLVNHIAEHTDIFSIDNGTITDVVGRSLAQGVAVRRVNDSYTQHFGVDKGNSNAWKYEPILEKPLLWWTKNLLTKIHIWGVLAKIRRRIIVKHSKSEDEVRPTPTPAKLEYSRDFPVIINTRDRYDPLVEQLKWLQQLGHRRILLVDNDSSYPPLLELFDTTPFQVIRLGRNAMHKAPWESMSVRFSAKDSPYILSDPDVVPASECPGDVFRFFVDLLNKYPDINKVGLGLRIDDIPDHFSQKKDVLMWESRYWEQGSAVEPDVYRSDVDTTMALYRPRTWWFLGNSLRTGGKYIARHEPWYQNSSELTADFVYYRMRASREVSTWGLDALPKHHMRALKKEGYIDGIEDEEDT